MKTPDFSQVKLKEINRWMQNTAAESLGIEVISTGTDWIEARMPVDQRTHQPAGLLHGGASVLLAETLGSIAGSLCVDREKQAVVGVEINANHLRGVRDGWVIGRVSPLHLGRTTQVWEIRIRDQADKLVCISRLTIAVIQLPTA
ncbi:thioesterase [bacterium (Candidatus Blackallbacteria) CG17_big_fil_post_rev_8_21_14_2_50_48_46]|uniref:Thioesterase n=1 Tax=bacterium (Candidatus Blackallbacteria) CG17_big_fil_post_rev_8_21_14_2_50_48_46 TaxID=2014261 RepID=A0A2M7G827_9BACT|nr:MAG: thioesterase [bacterium (Candidatus Blackallbacteria) CG18_big_fil_WC_8_21_14_2_50_49_26]PIW18240.1 MAG: thioesterase [bacterium (Candidatus Blackallbacteria) CG17_big_fil_post_rev_8_21_14_2_50_48_46]PIW50671.1 MAG: thioesterase [bacterium (Candidatus Blackallbacteria) CG13_big_fil_rev_8_21_14_2_50_49_14]